MSNRNWMRGMIIATVICCLLMILFNYKFDKYDYFSALHAEIDYVKGAETNSYYRLIKPNYVIRNVDEYNAVVIGGSKAGALETDVLNEVTGLNFYNSYFTCGCFRDYLAYTQFYLENMELEEVVLHISSFEICSYEPDLEGMVYNLPVLVSEGKKTSISEFLSFSTVNTLFNIKDFAKELVIGSDEEKGPGNVLTGYRDLSNYYEDEQRELSESVIMEQYDVAIEKLCTQTDRNYSAYSDNIVALRDIKRMCDEKGVRLTVIIGASFIGEKYQFEGEEFYQYLADMVAITDIYDFGGFYDVNQNPYNFYNPEHYYYEVGEEMIRIVYGDKQNEKFGTLLTKNNIYEYLGERRSQYNAIIDEYNHTGTVKLYDYEDASNICN